MIYYIYKINFLCGEPGRYYVGKHCARNWYDVDTYTGSGTFCKRYFKKYGKVNTYEKEILNFANNKQDLANLEELYIGDLYRTDDLCVNLKKGGDCDRPKKKHYSLSSVTKNKMSIARLGKKDSDETKQRKSLSHMGKHTNNGGGFPKGTKLGHRVYDNPEHTKFHLER